MVSVAPYTKRCAKTKLEVFILDRVFLSIPSEITMVDFSRPAVPRRCSVLSLGGQCVNGMDA